MTQSKMDATLKELINNLLPSEVREKQIDALSTSELVDIYIRLYELPGGNDWILKQLAARPEISKADFLTILNAENVPGSAKPSAMRIAVKELGMRLFGDDVEFIALLTKHPLQSVLKT